MYHAIIGIKIHGKIVSLRQTSNIRKNFFIEIGQQGPNYDIKTGGQNTTF